MPRLMSNKNYFFIFFIFSMIWGSNSYSDSYPNRPIRMIIPFAPGGGTDIVARLVSAKLSESLHQSIIIDNRTGGGGTVGAEIGARANPDGYTLLVASATTLAVNPILYKVSYDPKHDFSPISQLGSQSHLLVLNPSVIANSVTEFVALSKNKNTNFSYGSSGIGGPAHLGGELFKIVSGINMIHVPYKGTGPAVIDIVGGQIQTGILSIASCAPHIKTGKLKPLAIASLKRNNVFPNVPTIAESGYPGFEVRSWYGLLAPAKTPYSIVNLLAHQISLALNSADVMQRLKHEGADPGGDSPEQFSKYINVEIDRWAKVVRVAGIKAE